MKTETIQKPLWVFEPQPDITAYELAHIVGVLLTRKGKSFEELEAEIFKLPSDGHRHFRKTMSVYEQETSWLYRLLDRLIR